MGRTPDIVAPDDETKDKLLAPRREPLFDLEISVITPLFGGGAEPGVADLLAPVRASSIRGHLRFWWRACKCANFATADELFGAEEESGVAPRNHRRLFSQSRQ